MAAGKRGASLVRATLSIHHPPATLTGGLGGQIGQVRFQFNPNQLQLSRTASWRSQSSVGYSRGVVPEFDGVNPASLQIEVFLDGSAKPSASKVREDVEQLLTCCEVDPQSLPTKRPSPPWVRFAWGSFSTVQFVAYVESVSATYTLFTATGDPLRATCQLSLTEVPLPAKGQNPTSGTLAAQRVHRVVSGDSLESLAWQEYGDPTRWRAIATANAIDDPMRLETGRELLLPATEEVTP
ncbi:LysM peptidoglycan-binding domain-containing protein [Kineosporia sp. J2-2]|uniref:LysM peptidoglycan-binding domain-containing protein n=1 Tax=Kineosporia corallincola TaxID=2835133 RepID=A0ABS5TP43_9ACTN|nr:LysM peptidoglycan-binding domain-containing protein [Kineosporia corallincola]MBT0772875.1 LysM peptidoglycan-binding domain-containing protein [Kineosporia corallincola]